MGLFKSVFGAGTVSLGAVLSGAGLLALSAVATVALPSTSHAQTITCTGTGADTPTNNTEFIFTYNAANPGGSTCVINDNFSAATNNEGDFIFRLQIQTIGPEFFDYRTTAGAAIRDEHSVCNIGATVINNGSNCQAALGAEGVTTARLTYEISDGTTIAFTSDLNATVNGTNPAFTDIDVTAASVTITVPAAAATTNRPGSAQAVLVAATGRTQTRDTLRNIQKHVDVLTGGGVQGPGPSSAPAGGAGGGGVGGDGVGGGTDGGTEDGTGNENQFSAVNQLFEPDSFGRTTSNYGRTDGTNTLRNAAIKMAPYLQFDSASGDILANEWERLNQTENVGNDGGGALPAGEFLRNENDLNVWLYSSYSRIENERNETNDDQRFDGDVLTLSAGSDYRLENGVVLGAALSYSTIQLDTAFNDGSYDEDAYTISPYAIWQPTDWLTLNGSIGYTYSPIDQTSSETTNLTTSDTSGTSFFASINAKATQTFGDFTVAAFTGASGLHRTIEGFTDSGGSVTEDSTSISRELKAGGEAGYNLTTNEQVFFPYITAEVQVELADEVNNDPVAGEVGGGLRWQHFPLQLAASIEGTALVGRDDYSQYNVRGIIARSFDSQTLLGSLSPSLGLTSGAIQNSLGAGLGDTTTVTSVLEFGVNYQHNDLPLTMQLSAQDHVIVDDGPQQVRVELRYQF